MISTVEIPDILKMECLECGGEIDKDGQLIFDLNGSAFTVYCKGCKYKPCSCSCHKCSKKTCKSREDARGDFLHICTDCGYSFTIDGPDY